MPPDSKAEVCDRLTCVAHALVSRFPLEMSKFIVSDYVRYAANKQSCPFCFLRSGAQRTLVHTASSECIALECATCHMFLQITGRKVRWGFF